MRFFTATVFTAVVGTALACDSCEHPERDVTLTRHVRRMQPDAEAATVSPRGPLAWGQVNFLHTTDTHGWLEGHLKEKNYGADWGDYVSFVKAMRRKAWEHDVDLLVVDTGDLHDGAGLSDATSLDGELSNPVFEQVDYDLLTIGNHELYVTEVAYETFRNFSAHYGDRYVTSNVQIMNPSTSQFEFIGKPYRYFTTPHGLRIMAFGVLFDFKGNSNVSKVIPASEMVKQDWFQAAINTHKPVDMFVLIGHNPVRSALSLSTFSYVFNAIRGVHPDVPIQIFGGHTHIRDFAVYDDKSTALESGRYCETLGWLSMSGIKSPRWRGCTNPEGLPHPTMKAVNINPVKPTSTSTSSSSGSPPLASSTSPSNLLYSRRYLDWNRLTFEYHAKGSQTWRFDTRKGKDTTNQIYDDRKELNLTTLYGCAPQTWCISCAPFGSNGSIYTMLSKALSTVVINQTRADKSRMYVSNTGSIRFDLVKGPFTFDDSFIVSPFKDAFQFIPDVPFSQAIQVLPTLNAGPYEKKRDLTSRDFGFENPSLPAQDACVDPPINADGSLNTRSLGHVTRQQKVTPGYVTTDDFGTNGDDTVHAAIPYYPVPNDYSANGSFPIDGSLPEKVDFIFLDFIAKDVVKALNKAGGNYTIADTSYYLPANFTTNTFVTEYAKVAPDWQKDVPNCPVGLGVGYNDTSSS